jgi:hypothetical protein
VDEDVASTSACRGVHAGFLFFIDLILLVCIQRSRPDGSMNPVQHIIQSREQVIQRIIVHIDVFPGYPWQI